MAVCGVPEPSEEHADNIARMALAMMRCIQEKKSVRSVEMKLRIGINTGPVVAGIIGTSKFIYDLWGDTVNVASRMESHGLPGRVQTTVEMYDKLRDKFNFEERGEIEIKGKGIITTYFLNA